MLLHLDKQGKKKMDQRGTQVLVLCGAVKQFQVSINSFKQIYVDCSRED